MSTTITVVTPWWQSHELGPGYAAAMAEAGDLTAPNGVLVVDNASDPPICLPDAGYLGNYLRLDSNRGFSAACNAGLRAAQTDAVLWLNNDIVYTASGWLEPIRRALRPGLLVGAHLRTDPHSWVDGRPIPYLDGWCLAGMKADLVDLGGFDEQFDEPAYYVENDLCLRAHHAGMRLVQVNVALRHLSNYTSRRFDVAGVSARNRARFERRARELFAPAAA